MVSIYRKAAAVSSAIAALVALALIILASSASLSIRAALAIATLIISGVGIRRQLSLEGGFGLYLLASKKGLGVIDRLSKRNRRFWELLSAWGLVLGFGLLSYPLLRGRIDKRLFLFGMASIVVLLLFVVPATGSALQFVNVASVQNSIASSSSYQPSALTYVLFAITLIAGFSGFIVAALLYSSGLIISEIVSFFSAVISGTTPQFNQAPGVVPILPGIDIPLIAGIASLAILLTIHEVSHGVLARIHKVKLKSLGLLMFGVIPGGAFVEPDDKMVAKLNARKRTSIFSAGISANFAAMVVFFLLMVLLLTYVAPKVYSYGMIIKSVAPGYPAYNVITPGAEILQWNSHVISNYSTLQAAAASDAPNSIVTVTTRLGNNIGVYLIKAVPDPSNSSLGIIGISVAYGPIVRTAAARIVYFFYTLFALSMMLNFFIAVFNLLPIPGLDGWAIYKANVKNNLLVKGLAALVIATIVVNILPWLFYL